MPLLLEIHPITGAIVDSQLRYTFANRFNITWVSSGKSPNPDLDTSSRLNVAQGIYPLCKKVCFSNFDHGLTVAIWLQYCQC